MIAGTSLDIGTEVVYTAVTGELSAPARGTIVTKKNRKGQVTVVTDGVRRCTFVGQIIMEVAK